MSGPLGVLLAPGAGAGRDQPQLVAVDRAATAAGATVSRMDFPYRIAGKRAPDRPPVLLGAVVEAATALRAESERLVLGGRSMGGRICSMAVSGGTIDSAAGLLLISYPLHPPGRPERRRDEHFPAIEVPCLFVSGTRDAFATPEELEAATATIAGPVSHHWIEGKDHALRNADAAVAGACLAWLHATFPDELVPG